MSRFSRFIDRVVYRAQPHLLAALPFMTEKVFACPICGCESEYEAKNMCFELRRCRSCDHVYTSSIPKWFVLNKLYSGLEYWRIDKEHQGIRHIGLSSEWEEFLRARKGILRQVGLDCNSGNTRKVYEIGCSEGILLAYLQQCGHDASGCELNVEIAKRGTAEFGANIMVGAFEDLQLEARQYDYVLSFHTLEHVRDPAAVLRKISWILQPNGTVLIEVPFGPEEYSNLDHLHFFSLRSFKKLLDAYFLDSTIIENSYENSQGVAVGSYYGIGYGVKPGNE